MATDLKDLAKRLSALGSELKRLADLLDDEAERKRLGVPHIGDWTLVQKTLSETESAVKRLEDLIGKLDA